jgi:uncharacterized Fe-S cluster protein YjdI/CDGSH-type Zn-finger protein
MTDAESNDPRSESGVFEGKEITVYFDASRDLGGGECLSALPAVFDLAKDPWIQPDNASAEQVVRAVEVDPSGAFHYELKGGQEEQPLVPTRVEPQTDGAVHLRGDLRIVLDGGVLSETRAAICRCGRSGNKPFCDKTCERSGWSSNWHPPAE